VLSRSQSSREFASLSVQARLLSSSRSAAKTHLKPRVDSKTDVSCSSSSRWSPYRRKHSGSIPSRAASRRRMLCEQKPLQPIRTLSLGRRISAKTIARWPFNSRRRTKSLSLSKSSRTLRLRPNLNKMGFLASERTPYCPCPTQLVILMIQLRRPYQRLAMKTS